MVSESVCCSLKPGNGGSALWWLGNYAKAEYVLCTSDFLDFLNEFKTPAVPFVRLQNYHRTIRSGRDPVGR